MSRWRSAGATHPNKTAPGKPEGRWCTGIGFGVSIWGGGGGPACEVDVRIERDGSVSSAVGTQDLGTGSRTYVATIVAEEFGLPVTAVTARIGSSRLGQANGSGGSTTTASLAPAVKNAAWNARMKFAEHLGQALGTDPANIHFADGQVEDRKDGKKITFATGLRAACPRKASVRAASGSSRSQAPASTARRRPRCASTRSRDGSRCSRWSACRTAACRSTA